MPRLDQIRCRRGDRIKVKRSSSQTGGGGLAEDRGSTVPPRKPTLHLLVLVYAEVSPGWQWRHGNSWGGGFLRLAMATLGFVPPHRPRLTGDLCVTEHSHLPLCPWPATGAYLPCQHRTASTR